jgi:hypothetical protein
VAKDGTLSFTFRVAAKYAELSRFTFAESFGEAGAFYYWFDLGDFADPPPARPPTRSGASTWGTG